MEQKSIKLNAILNVMKTVFSLIFPLITFPYVTRMLQVEAMGKYDFSGSIISYFTLLAALGINIYAVREGSKYKNDKEKFVRVVKTLVANQNSNTQVTSVLHVLNDCDAVGDMHFIGDRDYFMKIAKKMECELDI